MNIKPLLLAFPFVCFACSSTLTDPSDPATQINTSPIMAKHPTGIHLIRPDEAYTDPCHMVDEELFRSTLKLDESVALEAEPTHDGCEYVWKDGKAKLSFAGSHPFESVAFAQQAFDKLHSGTTTPPSPLVKPDSTHIVPEVAPASVTHPTDSGLAGLGDQAVWNAEEGAMHTLYINHIINVQVETKGTADAKKEQARMLTEILMDRLLHGH